MVKGCPASVRQPACGNSASQKRLPHIFLQLSPESPEKRGTFLSTSGSWALGRAGSSGSGTKTTQGRPSSGKHGPLLCILETETTIQSAGLECCVAPRQGRGRSGIRSQVPGSCLPGPSSSRASLYLHPWSIPSPVKQAGRATLGAGWGNPPSAKDRGRIGTSFTGHTKGST